MGWEEKNAEVCAVDWEPQPVGRSQQSLVTSSDSHRVIPTEGGGGCWQASSTATVPQWRTFASEVRTETLALRAPHGSVPGPRRTSA